MSFSPLTLQSGHMTTRTLSLGRPLYHEPQYEEYTRQRTNQPLTLYHVRLAFLPPTYACMFACDLTAKKDLEKVL